VAVGAGVAGIEQLHGLEVDFTAFEDQGDQVVEPEVGAGQIGQGLFDESVDRIVLLAQDGGVVGVGGEAA
jgi:hypothetical protein